MPGLIERRRSIRVAVADHGGWPTRVRDISLGGLLIELPNEVPVGSIRDFALTYGGAEIVLRARVAHVRRESRPGAGTVFVVGVAFVADVSDQVALHFIRVAS